MKVGACILSRQLDKTIKNMKILFFNELGDCEHHNAQLNNDNVCLYNIIHFIS